MNSYFRIGVICLLFSQSYCKADSLKINHIVNLTLGSGASFQKVKDPNGSFLITNDFTSYIIKLLMNPSFQIGYIRDNQKYKSNYYFRYQLYEQYRPTYNLKNINPEYKNQSLMSNNSELFAIGFQNEKSFYKKNFLSLNRIFGAELGVQPYMKINTVSEFPNYVFALLDSNTLLPTDSAYYYWGIQKHEHIFHLNFLAGVSAEFKLANDISLSFILLYSQGTRNAHKTEIIYKDQIKNREGMATYTDRYSQIFLKARLCYYLTK